MRNQGSLIQFQTLWCTVRQRDRCERFCVSVLLRSLLTLSALQAFMARIRVLCCRVMSSQTLAILVTKGAVKSTRLNSDLMRFTRHEYLACAEGAAALSERKSQSVFVFVTNKRSRCLVMSNSAPPLRRFRALVAQPLCPSKQRCGVLIQVADKFDYRQARLNIMERVQHDYRTSGQCCS